jgi:carbon storage regulator
MPADEKGNSLGSGVGMLVLSRKRDESIVIDGNIVLTIVDIRGDKVRIGVEAPATVPVHRKEVHDALKRESDSAILPGTDPKVANSGS